MKINNNDIKTIDSNKCKLCNKQRDGHWALLFSIPKEEDVKKYHICPDCFSKIMNIKTKKKLIAEKDKNGKCLHKCPFNEKDEQLNHVYQLGGWYCILQCPYYLGIENIHTDNAGNEISSEILCSKNKDTKNEEH